MKVLIADEFQQDGVDTLTGAGCNVVAEPSLVGDELQSAVARVDPQVLIVRGTQVTEAMLQASERLSVVVRAGAGVNAIDIAAAARRGILVANCPGRNAVAVAELTFALILGLDRRIVEGVNDLRRGVWNKKDYVKARGLKGRTLGIVGMGLIGQAVARRAQAFEMPVVAWSRSLTDQSAEHYGVVACESPADAAAQCDILTIHLAATSDTEKIIDGAVLGRLKPGSYVINTARAEVIDYDALRRAIRDRGIRVGLDVFPDEPSTGDGVFSDPILSETGIVYGTHHIGASTDQAQNAISEETVNIVTHYMRTGQVKNCVNLRAESPAAYVVVVRHRNRPGVLAHTLNVISHAGVNVEEMENVICAGSESACAQIKLDGPLSQEAVAKLRSGNEHVFAVAITSITEGAAG